MHPFSFRGANGKFKPQTDSLLLADVLLLLHPIQIEEVDPVFQIGGLRTDFQSQVQVFPSWVSPRPAITIEQLLFFFVTVHDNCWILQMIIGVESMFVFCL